MTNLQGFSFSFWKPVVILKFYRVQLRVDGIADRLHVLYKLVLRWKAIMDDKAVFSLAQISFLLLLFAKVITLHTASLSSCLGTHRSGLFNGRSEASCFHCNPQLLGNVKTSWNPEMTADTITSSYWLTWKVFGCAAWLMVSTLFATFLISRYERSQSSSRGDRRGPGVVYEDEVWRPCLKGMHPVWLLGYRVVSFFLLLALLIVNAILDGGSTFFYYTQWTFTLVTIYFGLGSVLSMYGCYAQRNKVVGDRADSEMADAGQRSAAYPPQGGNGAKDDLDLNDHHPARRVSGFGGYAFQIIFQINAGTVVLTDCFFWFVIVPFLSTTRNFDLNFFVVNMHSVNIIFLLGDTALNSLVSSIPVVPNRIFHAMDDIIRELPMGPSCLLFHWVSQLHAFSIDQAQKVAVPILGLINFTCSSLVHYSRNNACPMLWRVHSSDKDEERSLVKILPRVFP
ncbi:hypothetical protein AKJ16_DCAP07937 [Drosera capensis]